jgi:hypothetical protein
MTAQFATGNASDPTSPASQFRGWLVGQFGDWAVGDSQKLEIAESSRVLATEKVGVKFQLEPKGRKGPRNRDDADNQVTLALLVNGRLRVELFDRVTGARATVELKALGDYLAWASSDFGHSWEALEDSHVVTIRWPESEATQES